MKRRNQTFCFLCDASDTVLSVKEKVVKAANQHAGEEISNKISTDFLRLLQADTVTILQDTDILGDCEGLAATAAAVANDTAVLYVVVKVADDEWETVDVVSTDMDDTTSTTVATPAAPA